jgi:hypothetical protein
MNIIYLTGKRCLTRGDEPGRLLTSVPVAGLDRSAAFAISVVKNAVISSTTWALIGSEESVYAACCSAPIYNLASITTMDKKMLDIVFICE